MALRELPDSKLEELEESLAGLIATESGQEINPEFTIFHTYNVKTVRENRPEGIEEVQVEVEGKPPKQFVQASTLFRSIKADKSDTYVAVFAPVEYDRPHNGRRLRTELEEPIKEILTEAATAQTVHKEG